MILITGATGTNGRELVKQLSAAGVPVRALVRDAAKASAIQAPGVDIVEGDLSKPETLPAALAGVERALLLTAWVPNQVELQGNFIEAARKAGVRHLAKFSVLGADPKSSVGILRQHGEVEQRVEASGIPYTLLRPNGFMQNFSAFAATISQGALYAPMAEGRVSFVDARDIAAVAVRVLTESGHEGRTHVITGPEALTHGEVAATLSAALGRSVTYVNVSPAQFADSMLSYGAPEWMADGLNELYGAYRAGAAAEVTDTVARVGKKAPISFDQFAREFASVLGAGA
jgi:uncharacterized protein YbjT (DUF2867 family)